jgi:hypothetical protein
MSESESQTTDDLVGGSAGHQSLFTGRSGHLAVMAEFLHRGINVAIPEVDVGDDIFVVRGGDEAITRVQVKSANGTSQQDGSYFAQFNVPWTQLKTDDTPALVYVFAVRHQNRWSDFVVIRRVALNRLQEGSDAGSIVRNNNGEPLSLVLRLAFTAGDVRNKQVSFQGFRGAFDPWPPPQP